MPAEEVDKLRDHVSRVEYRLDGVMPSWYEASGDLEEADYETDTDWYYVWKEWSTSCLLVFPHAIYFVRRIILRY